MHPHIEKLYQTAAKAERTIIGLMSGTSLDGLDIALCKIRGAGLQTELKVEHFCTLPYSADFQARVRAVFSKREVDLQTLTLLNPWIAKVHGQLINQCLAEWQIAATDIDVIASHGQTVFHCPLRQHQDPQWGNATLQLGDGDHLAVTTGITTISDFRQKHIAAGGEGAPLAVYGDYLLFSSATENRIMLNIGGIANLTWLPQSRDANAVFSTDIGPGNTLMDAYIRQVQPGQYFDEGAQLALQGQVSLSLLSALQQDPFFSLSFPKTTGPEVFNLAYLQRAQHASGTLLLTAADVMATLNAFTATMIAQAIKNSCAAERAVVYASGGGIHNPLLMQQLRQQLPQCRITTTAELNINPDAKEAVLFALLANECLVGGQQRFSNAREGIPSVTMGKVSFAD
ncbi:anhydro-N-acetylmuramic acid kinase [Alishewanella sp. d11]|uniref:anhydro-N-acetylmuramic acid kinase n=1 Tax=Alishewanella sp. d11 TaxID=3414030 RepID=UPI003BF80C24